MLHQVKNSTHTSIPSHRVIQMIYSFESVVYILLYLLQAIILGSGFVMDTLTVSNPSITTGMDYSYF